MIFKDAPTELLFQWYKGVMWLKGRKDNLTNIQKVVGYPFVVVGFFLDILYNLTYATYKFRDLPRELLFTSRLIRYKAGPTGWRKTKATEICKVLNEYDKEHC